MTFSEDIPIFAVPFAIFPGEQIAVHIFEPRYKLMISDVLKRGGQSGSFGITNSYDGRSEAIGCSAAVERVLERYPDGRYDLQIRGMIRYILRDLDTSGDYPVGRVDYFEDLELKPDHSLRSKAVSLHIKLVELASDQTHTPSFDENDRASFLLAHGAGFDNQQRQAFLEMRSERERLQYLIDYYRKVIPIVQTKHDLKKRVVLNGHIRKFSEEE